MLIILLYPGPLSDQRAKGRVAVKRPGGEAGDRYVLKAVKAMVLTALGLATDPEVLAAPRR